MLRAIEYERKQYVGSVRYHAYEASLLNCLAESMTEAWDRKRGNDVAPLFGQF